MSLAPLVPLVFIPGTTVGFLLTGDWLWLVGSLLLLGIWAVMYLLAYRQMQQRQQQYRQQTLNRKPR